MLERVAVDPVPLANPAGDLVAFRGEILASVGRVIDQGSYILGSEVAAFEKRMAERLGVKGAVGVASGTDALVLALLALGVGPGDEVVTVSHTAGPTVAAIKVTGATPVLVDVEPSSYCLDPKVLADAIGPLTRAIIVVHLYGHPADMQGVRAIAQASGIPIIEDCAQAQEATIDGRAVGSLGSLGCFSFYPTKMLGAIGDGGMVSAQDAAHDQKLRQLRTYGWTKPQYAEVSRGRCSRLDEIQAAILSTKLDHLDAQVERRRQLARVYNEAFKKLPLVLPLERTGCRHVYHLYVVRCDRREDFARHLSEAGIATGIHYPFPVHKQPALAAGVRIPRPLTVTEEISHQVLTLPLFATMTDAQQERVVAAVNQFFA